MLRVAKETDYGVLILCAIASNPETQGRTTRQISDETGIPYRMTCKVLHLLVRNGLIEAQRGVKGGYHLSRPPKSVSMIDVVQALEGPVSLTECSKEFGDCSMENCCLAKDYWLAVNDAFQESLSQVSLESILASKAKKNGRKKAHMHS